MKAPIITVIGSLSIASSCLIVAANSDRLAAGCEFVSKTKENTSTVGIFLWQILACIEIYWPLILIVSVSGFGIFRLAQRPVVACVFLLLPLLAVTYSIWRLPRPSEHDLVNYTYAGNVECILKIESTNSKNSLICRSSELVFPSRKPLSGKVLVTIYGEHAIETYQPNQSIQVFGKVSRIHHTNSSWQRNPGHKLVNAGIFSKLSSDSQNVKRLPQQNHSSSLFNEVCLNWLKFWESGRKVIIQTHENNLGRERGALLASMVLGERVVRLPDHLKALFRTVGLSHLLAASGFNLSIVVAVSYFCARLLPVPIYIASLTALLSTASFVCLAGPSPSVVRAALLCVLFLTARLFYRRVHALAALSLTLTIALIVDPLSIADVGLQLSYVATAGIISGLQWVSRKPDQSVYRRLTYWLRDTVSVICLAQLSILPLQLLYFRTAGILFLPANLLVDPVVAPVTVVGFLSSIATFAFSLLPVGIAGSSTIIALLDRLTSLALDYMIGCTSLLARFEETTMHFPPPVPGAIAIYYFSFIYFLYSLPNKHMRGLGCMTLLIGLSLLLFRPNIPGEITYLSKNTAMIIKNKRADILTGDKCDWLGKQVLSYTGNHENGSRVDDLRSRREGTEEITTTYFDDKMKPFDASMLELDEYILVSSKPSLSNLPTGPGAQKRTSPHLRKPFTWSQMTKVASMLTKAKTANNRKPILIWTVGRATALRQSREESNIYIAAVNAWHPLLLSKCRNKNLADSAADCKSDSKTVTRKAFPDQFYPFRVRQRYGQMLVLR